VRVATLPSSAAAAQELKVSSKAAKGHLKYLLGISTSPYDIKDHFLAAAPHVLQHRSISYHKRRGEVRVETTDEGTLFSLKKPINLS
jgi:hypothetical protein